MQQVTPLDPPGNSQTNGAPAGKPPRGFTSAGDNSGAGGRESTKLPSNLDSYDGGKPEDKRLFERLAITEELPPAAQKAIATLPSDMTHMNSRGLEVLEVDVDVPDKPQQPSVGANAIASGDSNGDLAKMHVTRDAKTVARFLRTCPNLSRTIIGNLLGENNEGCLKVLDEFTKSFSFEGLEFDQALRLFLESFRLPGESQKIYRLLESFSKYYHLQNPTGFASADAVHVLAFSCVMLNTDLHNSKVKKKMTVEEFIRNNRETNDGANFPAEFLRAIYKSIALRAIRIPSHRDEDELDPVYSSAVAAKREAKQAQRSSSGGWSCFGGSRAQS